MKFEKDLEKYTPMMRQYLSIKQQHPEALLFFRLGDFFELFFNDAVIASKELDLTLTSRGGGLEEKIPMCGVPYHVADQYLSKLLAKGYHVAICDQVEDPKDAKGIVKREVTRIVTPGTFTDVNYLKSDENNYLLCIVDLPYSLQLSYIDYSTGELNVIEKSFLSDIDKKQFLFRELFNINPSEVICNPTLYNKQNWIQEISSQYNISINERKLLSVEDITRLNKNLSHNLIKEINEYLQNNRGSNQGLYILLDYILEMQKSSLDHILSLHTYTDEEFLKMDEAAKKNLELFVNLSSRTKDGSLFKVLDENITSMGSRMLKQWIDKPLRSLSKIKARQDFIEELLNDFIFIDDLRELLRNTYDIERLAVKISGETITAKEIINLKITLIHLEKIRKELLDSGKTILIDFGNSFPSISEIISTIDEILIDEIPAIIGETRIIREGYDTKLDHLFLAKEEGQQWIVELEKKERNRTGIKNLKIKYNKILGYFIEITKSNLKSAPEDYIRKQTLVGSERFFSIELKNMESDILGSKEEALSLQNDLLTKLKKYIHIQLPIIKKSSMKLAQMDVLLSLAKTAQKYSYTKPDFNNDKKIMISSGRHPMVEANMKNTNFVPNDAILNQEDYLISIITGPNMSGKSTYMRQVALICIMAQIGSYVPAEKSSLCILDRVFTRIGASDNLSSGDSTFMVEMKEVATIANEATTDSLIILDEVGRGTGTYDGLSIAWALVEFLSNSLKAKTLFATHYQELTLLENSFNSVKNLAILTEETVEGIVFLRKIVSGASNESFGIDVAKLAGVSDSIIERARDILFSLESQRNDQKKDLSCDSKKIIQNNLNAFKDCEQKLNSKERDFLNSIQTININEVTPLESLNILSEIVNQAKNLESEG